MDQDQQIINGTKFLTQREWQEFIPQGRQHLYIEVHIGCFNPGSSPLGLSIEQPKGHSQYSTVKSAVDIPDGYTDWTRFYVNVKLTPNEPAYIALSPSSGSEYAWSYGTGNPYPDGISSFGEDYDFCFRTFVDRSKKIDGFSFFEKYPLLYNFFMKFLLI